MKDYAACEQCVQHSMHPRWCEYLYEDTNALLTVPRAVGTFAGNAILETREEVKGRPSTYRKGLNDDEIDT